MLRRLPLIAVAILTLAAVPACESPDAGNPFAEATAVTAAPASTTTTIGTPTSVTAAPPTTGAAATTTTSTPADTTTTTAAPAGGRFSDAVRAEYLDGCLDEANTEFCVCTLDYLEQRYTEAEFMAMAESFDEAALPPPLAEAVAACFSNFEAEPLVLWTDSATVTVFESLAAEFQAREGIAVEVAGFDLAGGGLFDAVSAALAEGSGPDLFLGINAWLPALGSSIDRAGLGAEREARLMEAAVAAFNVNGQLMALPVGLRTSVLVRNTDLVDVAPANWDEFRNACNAARGATDRCLVVDPADTAFVYTFMASGGGYVYGYDPATGWDDGDVGLDTEGAIATFTELDNLVRQGHIRPDDTVDPIDEFAAARVPFVVIGSNEVQSELPFVGVPWSVSPLPGFGDEPATTFSLATGLILNGAGGQIDAAREFLRFLVRPTPMRDIAAALGDGQINGEAIDQIPDITAAMLSIAAIASQPLPPLPTGTLWITPLTEAGRQIFRQTNGPIQALRDAAAQTREAIAGG